MRARGADADFEKVEYADRHADAPMNIQDGSHHQAFKNGWTSGTDAAMPKAVKLVRLATARQSDASQDHLTDSRMKTMSHYRSQMELSAYVGDV